MPPLVWQPPGLVTYYLFTDGSAHRTACRGARLTYWSVAWCKGVQREEDLDDWFALLV